MKKVFFAVMSILLAAAVFAQSEDDFTVRRNRSDNTLVITAYNGAAKDVIIPDTINGIEVTAVGRISSSLIWQEFAFNYKGLTSVVIPDTITALGNSTFASNKFAEITLPANLKGIGHYAFANNQIRSLTIPDGVTVIELFAFQNNPLTTLIINSPFTTSGAGFNGPFSGCPITKITLPEGMNDVIMERNFEETLIVFWKSQDRAAGTYIKNESGWTLESN